MACVPFANDQTLIIVGERGGSADYPNGVLRWAILNNKRDALSWSEKSVKCLAGHAPGEGDQPQNKSDSFLKANKTLLLWVQGDGRIW